MVKVFLCTYNGEKYIRAQLDSILAQDTEEAFSILVSDDASSDGTADILRDYAARYPDIAQIHFRKEATGNAWRHFLSLFADGYALGADYVFLSDQDDVWKPEKISRSLTELRAVELLYGTGTPVLVHCDSAVVDEKLSPIADSFVRYQKMSPGRKGFSQLLVQNNVVGAGIAVNASLASLLYAVPDHAVMHDQWIALVASAFGEIRFLPKPLYLYRQHRENVLGADKGSFLGEVLGRFGLFRRDGLSKEEVDAKSKAVYQGLFQQAESFRDMYGEKLSKENLVQLNAFLRIPEKSRLEKIWTILRHGFTYNLPHRTIGECIFI